MSVEMLKLAVHLLLVHQERFLLLRRYNTGFEDGKYSVVAGHVNQREDLKAAMAREASEEAGIILAQEDLQIIGVIHRPSLDTRVDFFLTARSWAGEIRNREPHKCDNLDWFDKNSLPENIIPYIQKAITMYLHYNHQHESSPHTIWFVELPYVYLQ